MWQINDTADCVVLIQMFCRLLAVDWMHPRIQSWLSECGAAPSSTVLTLETDQLFAVAEQMAAYLTRADVALYLQRKAKNGTLV